MFFVVDSDQQNMLLGLPVLMAANLRLLTVEGDDLMLSASRTFGLDIASGKVAMLEKMMIPRLLNLTAIDYRT